jgi:hypothetical protein
MSFCSAPPLVAAGRGPLVSLLLGLLGVIGPAAAEEQPLDAYARVAVAPTKTSIYVGRVSLEMTTFERAGGRYSSTYVAKVFPYFFYNESGQLSVEISDAALHQLERGEVIEFQGRAVTTDGDERRITGRAIPESARRGKIKVRVALPGGIQLIFNSAYVFTAP